MFFVVVFSLIKIGSFTLSFSVSISLLFLFPSFSAFVLLCIRYLSQYLWRSKMSFVLRVFTHGVMGHWIHHSWWTYWAISRSSQCSTTGVTKAVVCVILSVGWCIKKTTLLLIGKSRTCSSSRFPLSLFEWSFTICLMPYNHK